MSSERRLLLSSAMSKLLIYICRHFWFGFLLFLFRCFFSVLLHTICVICAYARSKRTHPGINVWLKHCTRIGYTIIIASSRSYSSTRFARIQMSSFFFLFILFLFRLQCPCVYNTTSCNRALHALHVYAHFSCRPNRIVLTHYFFFLFFSRALSPLCLSHLLGACILFITLLLFILSSLHLVGS